MLTDPQLNEDMLRFFEDYGVKHPQVGVFLVEVLNFHLAITDSSRTYDAPYGVCDSLDQLRRHSTWEVIARDPRAMTLILTPVRRSEQEPGDWRWHKWGEYIGDQVPQCEYIADEPVIELVYVFEVIILNQKPTLPAGV